VIVEYIDDHKQRLVVEPICRVLTEHGCKVSSSTHYDARNRQQSTRSVRDEELKTEIARVHEENYSVYGARKVWLQLARENITVARCTVERLMGDLGLEGARRGKTKRTTVADPQAYRAGDMVERQFNPVAPNVLWVADFTYVSTWSSTRSGHVVARASPICRA
jgi:putative transposase